jgi:hypothetical protein
VPAVSIAGIFLYLGGEEEAECSARFFWVDPLAAVSLEAARRQQLLLLCKHLSCSSQVTGGVPCMQKTWYIGSPAATSLQGNHRSRYIGQAFLCLRQFEFSDGFISIVPATRFPS